ncbi:MAG: macrolide ABC transporter ATP-binding protein [Gammaproteobacteria bacterium RBG_16_66_13]|nr:MAG: macrolide ABC transporter ATP-binding protein [Gammaproteobacteria bacterium RBG_16_66_13]
MDTPLIRTSELGKTYVMGRERVHALSDVNLTIARNSFTAVIGPSGSGKSTLLHLLGGLDRPTAGSIHVDGSELERLDENALAAYRRDTVGFIFQTYNLLPSMSAIENAAFPLRFAGVPRKQRLERALGLLGDVGVADRAFHRPDELSGGQQQRVAAARALVHDPQLILADEPTGNLDSHTGLQIMQLLADFRGQGRTVVVVSHDPRIARFASHMVRLLDGRVVGEKEYEAALQLADA